jgi:ATP-dependent Clp protease ATP-binding subunit ClpC
MYERFTDRARKVMNLAGSEAKRLNHKFIGDEHILLGMMAESEGLAAHVLRHFGVDLKKTRSEIWAVEPALPDDSVKSAELPLTAAAKRVIEESMKECRNLDHHYVGTEHLLLGLCRQSEGLAVRLLIDLGLKPESIRQGVLNVLGHGA